MVDRSPMHEPPHTILFVETPAKANAATPERCWVTQAAALRIAAHTFAICSLFWHNRSEQS